MAVSFNPMKLTQPTANGDAVQMQGNNTVANHSTTSPYTVPEGADYVTVSSDAAATITATPLLNNQTGYSTRYEGAFNVDIPNVIPGVTIITVA